MYFYIIMETGEVITNVLILSRRGLALSKKEVTWQLFQDGQILCRKKDDLNQTLCFRAIEIYEYGIMKKQPGSTCEAVTWRKTDVSRGVSAVDVDEF